MGACVTIQPVLECDRFAIATRGVAMLVLTFGLPADVGSVFFLPTIPTFCRRVICMHGRFNFILWSSTGCLVILTGFDNRQTSLCLYRLRLYNVSFALCRGHLAGQLKLVVCQLLPLDGDLSPWCHINSSLERDLSDNSGFLEKPGVAAAVRGGIGLCSRTDNECSKRSLPKDVGFPNTPVRFMEFPDRGIFDIKSRS